VDTRVPANKFSRKSLAPSATSTVHGKKMRSSTGSKGTY